MKVLKHGKAYREKQEIYYVTCPECQHRVGVDISYSNLVVCKCECEFEVSKEDIKKGVIEVPFIKDNI